MTTIKTTLRITALVLRSIPWAAIGRGCCVTARLLFTLLVLLAEIAWEHRQQIRQALVTAIAAVIVAAQLTLEAGRWTRCTIDAISGRTVALLPQQPVAAVAPITACLTALREALERLVRRLYPVAA